MQVCSGSFVQVELVRLAVNFAMSVPDPVCATTDDCSQVVRIFLVGVQRVVPQDHGSKALTALHIQTEQGCANPQDGYLETGICDLDGFSQIAAHHPGYQVASDCFQHLTEI